MAFGKLTKRQIRKAVQMDVMDNKKKRVPKATKEYVQKQIKVKGDHRNIESQIVASFSDAGYIGTTNLSDAIREGDSAYAYRQGDKIELTRLEFRYTWQVGDSNNICRFIVFQWHPDDNVTPPSVLNEVVSVLGQGTVNFPHAPYIFDKKNFTILYDGLINTCDTASNMATRPQTVNIYSKKLRNVRYTNGVGAGHNNIYYVAMTDSAIAPHPQLRVHFRLYYNA